MATPTSKRDPIKEDPLREPAESLMDRRFDLILDKIGFWMLLAIFAIAMTVNEWYRWAFSLPPSPMLYSATAVGFVAFAGYRFWKINPELTRLRLAIRGEKAVGQFLQRDVVPLGYRVFHDICEDDCNIDHVAIGPGGVFSIETKTHSKPAGEARVVFDGRQVTVNGFVPDRDPIGQAQACAASLRRILKQYAGIDEKPRAVVLYPGWYVKETKAETWVLNETRFVGYLRNETGRLSQQQINVLAEGLARYMRDRQRKEQAK